MVALRLVPTGLVLTLLLMPPLGLSGTRTGQAASRGEASLLVRGRPCPYPVFGVFVLPGESLPVEVDSTCSGPVEARASAGSLAARGPRAWAWTAPRDAGLYTLKFRRSGGDAIATLNVFVLVPISRLAHGVLNHYHIGQYPSQAFKDLPAYRRPPGFVEVTPQNEDAHLSPHFTLRQFETKQGGGYPRYVVLQEGLLSALEGIVSQVRGHGLPTSTLEIMSGYRTPFYNRAIGNETTFSRHVWGDAADIYVVAHPGDGRMEDLNGDGRVDLEDARLLARWVGEALSPEGLASFPGGLAAYPATSSHGPFVHVDLRGFPARWGPALPGSETYPRNGQGGRRK